MNYIGGQYATANTDRDTRAERLRVRKLRQTGKYVGKSQADEAEDLSNEAQEKSTHKV